MKYNFKQETDTAKLPTRHTAVSAGVDFYADEKKRIPAGKSMIVSTGISWNPEHMYHNPVEIHMDSISLIIQSRSGLAFKHGIEASNAGVIDQDYVSTEENKAIIKVKLYNHSNSWFNVNCGDKICQGIPQLIPYFSDVETLDDNRNGKGFGSSDEKESKNDCYSCIDFDNCSKDPKLPRRITCYANNMNQYMKDPDYVPFDEKQVCHKCKEKKYCPECGARTRKDKDNQIYCPGCGLTLDYRNLVAIDGD